MGSKPVSVQAINRTSEIKTGVYLSLKEKKGIPCVVCWRSFVTTESVLTQGELRLSCDKDQASDRRWINGNI
ncbi:hypothetical protein AKJ16_DCAP11251 [Drosera capensis]